MEMQQYLQPTRILNYYAEEIQKLTRKKFLNLKTKEEKVKEIYYFVRDGKWRQNPPGVSRVFLQTF